MEIEILALIEEDSKVAVRARLLANHSAEAFGIPATGKRIRFEALEVFRIEKGLGLLAGYGNQETVNVRTV